MISVKHQSINFIYRFFKRASHQGTNILLIHTVPCDGHEVTIACHYITQQRQVTMIDICTIKRDNMIHFLFNSLTNCLNTQNLQNNSIHVHVRMCVCVCVCVCARVRACMCTLGNIFQMIILSYIHTTLYN